MIRSIAYTLRVWWLKRAIRVCHYRRDELHRIVARELDLIAYEENRLNRKLREVKSAALNARLGEVSAPVRAARRRA